MRSLQNVLLVCGIVAVVIYIGTDLFLSMNYPGYSITDQAISELSAVGAPTAPFWIAMTFIFNPLLIIFGFGVRRAAVKKRFLHITGTMIAIWGLLGFMWLLFPMHMRGEIGSTTDTMHLVMAAVTVLLMVAFISFGSVALGKRFRFYSILTIAMMLIFGGMVGQQASRVAAQLPTPWMGVLERVSVYLPMFWVLFLAVALLRIRKDTVL